MIVFVSLQEGVVGYAMMLGKLPVSGCPAYLDNSRQEPTALAVCADGGCLGIFVSSIISLFFLPLARYRQNYCHYCLKGPLNQKKPKQQFARTVIA